MSTLQKTHEGEHHGDFGNVAIKMTRATYVYALCASLNSCNLGYDIGVSTNAGRLVQDDLGLSRIQRELFLGSLNLWAAIGGLLAHFISDRWGRRRTFVVAAVGFILGNIIMILSQGYTLLMIGRFFVGLGIGVGLAIDPMYIAEVTPAKYRGEMVTWAEIFSNIGIVFGFATGLILSGVEDDGTKWRIMFLMGCFLPVVMILLVSCGVMPESPRWLVAKGRNEEGREILQRIYPAGFNVEPVLQDIEESIDRDSAAENGVGWSVIFHPSPAFRRMLLAGCGTAVAQQFCGIDGIQYYLLDLIEESGIESDEKQSLVLVLLGMIKLIFIVVGGKLFDKRGRRPLLFASQLGMSGSLVIVGVALLIHSGLSTGATITGLALYLAFFSIGMGPGAWLIPSEVFSLSIRAKAMSVATFLNRGSATLVACTSLSMANAIGYSGYFLLLALSCIVLFVFLYKFVPETKGRSLEDMSIYFAELTGDHSVLEAEAELVKRRPQETKEDGTPPPPPAGEVL